MPANRTAPDQSHLLWHSGPPPAIGWWPAGVSRSPSMLRWWDGHAWSAAAYPEYTEQVAAQKAAQCDAEVRQDLIEWTCQWWVPSQRKAMLKRIVLNHRSQLREYQDLRYASAQAADAAQAMIAKQSTWSNLLKSVRVAI